MSTRRATKRSRTAPQHESYGQLNARDDISWLAFFDERRGVSNAERRQRRKQEILNTQRATSNDSLWTAYFVESRRCADPPPEDVAMIFTEFALISSTLVVCHSEFHGICFSSPFLRCEASLLLFLFRNTDRKFHALCYVSPSCVIFIVSVNTLQYTRQVELASLDNPEM